MEEQEEKIITLNEDGEEISEEECDLELGYFTYDQRLKEHHDAVEFQAEEGHYYPQEYFFADKTSYKTPIKAYYDEHPEDNNPQPELEKDPHVGPIDESGQFTFIPQTEEEQGKEIFGIDVKWVIDKPQVNAKEAWDEYEDIRIYHLYTEEQLQQREEEKKKREAQQRFMTTGPERLDEAEVNISATESSLSTVQTNVDDITMLLADMIGV